MRRLAASVLLGVLASCAAGDRPAAPAPPRRRCARGSTRPRRPIPFPSTYRPGPSGPVAIVGATVLTGTGAEIANGTVLIADGRIEAVGRGLAVPDGYAPDRRRAAAG